VARLSRQIGRDKSEICRWSWLGSRPPKGSQTLPLRSLCLAARGRPRPSSNRAPRLRLSVTDWPPISQRHQRGGEGAPKGGAKLGGLRGGERGIRTLVRVSPKHAFQACAFNHSATSPHGAAPLGPRSGGAQYTDRTGLHNFFRKPWRSFASHPTLAGKSKEPPSCCSPANPPKCPPPTLR
jgi:hypothetical protein